MLILGLDPSQTTGYAYYEPGESLSTINVGTIRAAGGSYEVKAATLAQGLVRLIAQRRPDFIAMEMPLRTAPGVKRKKSFMGEEQEAQESFGALNAVISSNQMVGACAAIIGAYKIPFEMIAPITWRKHFLGFGRKPDWGRKDWKRATRQRCEQLKIRVTNDDQADAVGIAVAGEACQIFKSLKQGRAA